MLGAGRPAAADFGAASMTDLRRFDLVDVTSLVTPADATTPAQTDLRLTLRPLATREES